MSRGDAIPDRAPAPEASERYASSSEFPFDFHDSECEHSLPRVVPFAYRCFQVVGLAPFVCERRARALAAGESCCARVVRFVVRWWVAMLCVVFVALRCVRSFSCAEYEPVSRGVTLSYAVLVVAVTLFAYTGWRMVNVFLPRAILLSFEVNSELHPVDFTKPDAEQAIAFRLNNEAAAYTAKRINGFAKVGVLVFLLPFILFNVDRLGAVQDGSIVDDTRIFSYTCDPDLADALGVTPFAALLMVSDIFIFGSGVALSVSASGVIVVGAMNMAHLVAEFDVVLQFLATSQQKAKRAAAATGDSSASPKRKRKSLLQMGQAGAIYTSRGLVKQQSVVDFIHMASLHPLRASVADAHPLQRQETKLDGVPAPMSMLNIATEEAPRDEDGDDISVSVEEEMEEEDEDDAVVEQEDDDDYFCDVSIPDPDVALAQTRAYLSLIRRLLEHASTFGLAIADELKPMLLFSNLASSQLCIVFAVFAMFNETHDTPSKLLPAALILVAMAAFFALGTRVWRLRILLKTHLDQAQQRLDSSEATGTRRKPSVADSGLDLAAPVVVAAKPTLGRIDSLQASDIRVSDIPTVFTHTCNFHAQNPLRDPIKFWPSFRMSMNRLALLTAVSSAGIVLAGVFNAFGRFPECSELVLERFGSLKASYDDCSSTQLLLQHLVVSFVAVPLVIGVLPITVTSVIGPKFVYHKRWLLGAIMVASSCAVFVFLRVRPDSQDKGYSRVPGLLCFQVMAAAVGWILYRQHSDPAHARKYAVWLWLSIEAALLFTLVTAWSLSIYVNIESDKLQLGFALVMFPLASLLFQYLALFLLYRCDQHAGRYPRLHVVLYTGVHVFFSFSGRMFLTSLENVQAQVLAVLIWGSFEVAARCVLPYLGFALVFFSPCSSREHRQRWFVKAETARGDPFHRLRLYSRMVAEYVSIFSAIALTISFLQFYDDARTDLSVGSLLVSGAVQLSGELLTDLAATKIEHSYLQRHIFAIWVAHNKKQVMVSLAFGMAMVAGLAGEYTLLVRVQ